MNGLALGSRRLEILSRVLTKTEIEMVSGNRFFYIIRVATALVSDCRADEIRPVGIEAFLNQQIDLAQVNVAEVDGDLLAVGRFRP